MADINTKLAVADQVLTITQFLAIGLGEDFISRPEAAGIYKDILKETGFKTAPKVVKPETAPKKEAKVEGK